MVFGYYKAVWCYASQVPKTDVSRYVFFCFVCFLTFYPANYDLFLIIIFLIECSKVPTSVVIPFNLIN